MCEREFKFDLAILRRKKEVRYESLELIFEEKTDDGRKSRTKQDQAETRKKWRTEMAALRRSVTRVLRDEVEPLGGGPGVHSRQD